MTREKAPLERTLPWLLRRLVVDTSRWTYAAYGGLRAVAAPYVRHDGRWDVRIDIQPVRRGALHWTAAGRQLLVEKLDGGPGSIAVVTCNQTGRSLRIEGLEGGRYRVVPATLAALLSAATRHCQECWAGRHALAAAPPVKADHEIWQWQSPDARLHGHAVLQTDGDLVFRFWSSDLSLEGVRLFVRAGIHRLPLVLVRHAERELLGEVTLPRSVRQIAASPIAFEVEQA